MPLGATPRERVIFVKTADVLSINVGTPQPMHYKGSTLMSAYMKKPVTEPIFLGKTNFDGDDQADRKAHGGPDKAVCV